MKGNDVKDLILLAKGHTRRECPFDGAEVWGVNDVGSFPEFKGKKIDRLFTFDPRSDEFIKDMKAVAPITSWRDYADVKYPIDELIEHFGTRYFTNTISFMVALAIYEGFTRIRMYGVDAPYGGIYFMEKSGLEYWIGRAQQAGMEIIPCKESHILRTHDDQLYGERKGKRLIPLYLSERMIIINTLPTKGNYDTIYRSGLVRWFVGLKDKERIEHKVELGHSTEGHLAYKCDHEFLTKVYFTEWALEYLIDLLRNMEREGKLPINMVSVYEKLVLCNTPDKVGDTNEKEVRVSYILPTKNRENIIRKSLEDIRKLLTPKDELIVVDGSTNNDTLKVLEEYADVITRIIPVENDGHAHGLNIGIMESRGEYVKPLADDDVVSPEEMERAIDYLNENRDIDLLVCGGVKQQGVHQFVTVAPKNYGHDVKDVFTYGACMVGFIHRRDSFSKLGLYDTSYVDIDQEIATRAISMGLKVKFFPGKHYFHATHTNSTGYLQLAQWNKDNRNLIKQYCPRVFYYKYLIGNKIRSFKSNIRGWLTS